MKCFVLISMSLVGIALSAMEEEVKTMNPLRKMQNPSEQPTTTSTTSSVIYQDVSGEELYRSILDKLNTIENKVDEFGKRLTAAESKLYGIGQETALMFDYARKNDQEFKKYVEEATRAQFKHNSQISYSGDEARIREEEFTQINFQEAYAESDLALAMRLSLEEQKRAEEKHKE